MAVGGAIASALIAAGSAVHTAKEQKKSRKNIQERQEAADQKAKEQQFQEAERAKASARKASLFEQQAGQKIIDDQARARGITPVFSDLSNAVLSPNGKATI